MIRRPPRSTLFPTRRSSDLVACDYHSPHDHFPHHEETVPLRLRHRPENEDLDLAPDQSERSEEHTSELQSRLHLVCRLLLEKKKTNSIPTSAPALTVTASTS